MTDIMFGEQHRLERMLRERDAEIERLTALAQSNDDITWELTGEIERLRAALQFYADDCAETGLIARRALEPKP